MPSLFVVKVFFTPVFTFNTETVALGTTALDGSVTVPRISPVEEL
jgi:hypothetical protein